VRVPNQTLMKTLINIKLRPPDTHYGHLLADPDTSGQAVHLDGIAPVFTLSFHDSERSRKLSNANSQGC